MAYSGIDGAFGVYGSTPVIRMPPFAEPVGDETMDAGPSWFYQGLGLLDPRILYPKDKISGYTGAVQGLLYAEPIVSVRQIPATVQTNNIAAAQNVTSGTAMTLAAAATGIALNVPIVPWTGILNGAAPVIAGIAIDFGFAFGNCTAGSPTIQVASTSRMRVGDPLVIAGVGNVAGTACLLTQVATIVDATHITVPATAQPLATNATAPIGSGNLWGASEIGYPIPTAAMPFLAKGPFLALDPRQSITRAVSITGVAGGAGGAFLVSGWDIYGQPMTQTVTVAAGANTVYSLKCFKYIASVTPQFTDAHTYSVGTSDQFGFNVYAARCEDTVVWWAAALMTSTTGFTVPDQTTPATSATGDVRGTIQTGTAGGGSGIGSTASNGTIVSLAMSGNFLNMASLPETVDQLLATPMNPATMFGTTPQA